jgi:hypothetical protein
MNTRTIISGLLILISVALSLPANSQQRRVGTNLPELSCYSTAHVFGNAMKQSCGWFIRPTDLSEWNVQEVNGVPMQMPVDENGYPLEAPFDFNGEDYYPHCLMLYDQPAPWYYPSGDYTLILEGTGVVELEHDVAQTTYTAPGTYTINIPNPSEYGIHLTILSSDVNDPISDIGFYFPDHEPSVASHPFNDRFLEITEGWEVLRFIKATQTEENPIVNWGDRTTIDRHTYNIDEPGSILYGMPWELVIELCNLQGVDPWICLPYQANDQYIDSLAALFYNGLHPDLKVYIEYSNETWNWNYWMTNDYVNNQGVAAGYSTSLGEAGIMFSTIRLLEMIETFQQVYGSEYDDRVRSVAATQGWSWPIDVVYQTLTSNQLNPNGTMPHAIACAPYFCGELMSFVDSSMYCNLTEAQIFDSLYHGINMIIQESFVPFREYADSLNVDFYTYESGYHIAELNFGQFTDSCLIELFNAVNRDPEMENVYCTYMDSMFMNYDLDMDVSFVLAKKYGGEHFGILESQYQDVNTSPKWRAFDECSSLSVYEFDVTESDLRVYPNPLNSELNISGVDRPTVRLIDFSGKEIMKVFDVQGSIAIPQIPNGMYLLEISDDAGNVQIEKVMKY